MRQRQSRAFPAYDCINFSGYLGVDDCVSRTGNARLVRRILSKYGVSSEFVPRYLTAAPLPPHAAAPPDSGVRREVLPVPEAVLEDLEGHWNLQGDAPVRAFMDFSDFFVLPYSPLPRWWRMSREAMRDATLLQFEAGTALLQEGGASKPADAVTAYLLGVPEATEAAQVAAAATARRKEMAAAPRYRDEAPEYAKAEGDGDMLKPCKPNHSQCWYMELDDSPMSTWACGAADGDIIATIDAMLPKSSDKKSV